MTGATFTTTAGVVAVRTLRKFMRTPQLLVASTATTALFLVLFTYVFGGALRTAGPMSYRDFLVPGFVVSMVLFAGMGASTGVTEDLQSGMVDRLRSLPISRTGVVLGRVLADTTLVGWSMVETFAIGYAVGFRIHVDIGSLVAAAGLAVVYGMSFCWLFVTLGFLTRTPQAAQSISFLVFPLTFVSSSYVPVSTMPHWLQGFAEHQPVTVMADTVRILTEGHPASVLLHEGLGSPLLASLLWCAGLVLVCAPLAVWRYVRS